LFQLYASLPLVVLDALGLQEFQEAVALLRLDEEELDLGLVPGLPR
jgi:hypothetical protein